MIAGAIWNFSFNGTIGVEPVTSYNSLHTNGVIPNASILMPTPATI